MRSLILTVTLICLLAAPSYLTASGQSAKMMDLLENTVESFEVHDTPIEDVLRLLASQNNLNLIIGPDSMGSVSLRFSEVSLKSAFDAILRAKGYSYNIYDNIMLVLAPDSLERVQGLGRETKLFKLKYADARDVKTTLDTAKVLSPWGQVSIYYRAMRTDAVKAYSLKPGLDFIEGKTIDLREPVPFDKTPMQTRSDIVIVTDLPPRLEKVAKLIDILDQPSRQVMIEVHFVETILNDDKQLGIDWYNMLEVDGSYQGRTNWEFGGISEDAVGVREGGILQFGSLSATRSGAVLQTLVKNDNSKLLSQPSITTLDNQAASITVGVTTWIEERTGSVSTGDVQITYRERQVPIELVVVPHILHGDEILLEIRPRVEEITGFQEGVGNLSLPLISTRTADSRVQVIDGQTAVIGGLITEKNRYVEKKVWGLSSLPMIGHLFRHQVKEKSRSDLSIFITPRILKSAEELKEMTRKMKENEKKIQAMNEFKTRITPKAEIPLLAKAEKPGLNKSVKVKKQAVKPKAKAKVDPRLIVDLRKFFPLSKGAHWGYRWRQSEGASWESSWTVSKVVKNIAQVEELVPSGPRKSEAVTAYSWLDEGMQNLYRVNGGGDSTVYDPPRMILPAEMVKGRRYMNQYNWSRWSKGKNVAEGTVEQQQRIVGSYSVSTGVGRFKKCVAVETIWFDPDDSASQKKRKVVWYAPEFGPVKVEFDIPVDAPALQGELSALLVKKN